MQIIELAKKLQNVGLSDKQARVYIAALFLGSSPVQRLAEQAEINRATAYVILDELRGMGLVTEVKVGKKIEYVAEDPDALDTYLNKEIEHIRIRKETLSSLKQELQASKGETTANAPKVRFYKGPDGIKSALRYMARTSVANSEVYGFFNYDEASKINDSILKDNASTRVRKNITSNVIYYSKDATFTSDSKTGRETRRTHKPIAADISLYNDKIALLTYAERDSIGVIIESPEITMALRQLFEIAWSSTSED
mgnify:CR=1 FL=1